MWRKPLAIITVLLAIILSLISCQNEIHVKQINAHVTALNGSDYQDDTHTLMVNPFNFGEVTKDTPVYHFYFNKDGARHEGWVRFGFFDTIWIIDGQRTVE